MRRREADEGSTEQIRQSAENHEETSAIVQDLSAAGVRGSAGGVDHYVVSAVPGGEVFAVIRDHAIRAEGAREILVRAAANERG